MSTTDDYERWLASQRGSVAHLVHRYTGGTLCGQALHFDARAVGRDWPLCSRCARRVLPLPVGVKA